MFHQPQPEYADLLIVDEMIPCAASPFRTVEYAHYLAFFDARLLSLEGWHLWISNESFADHLERLPVSRELKERIVPFIAAKDTLARLAYVTFLGNAAQSLAYFERRQLPFIFQLYPGGGFEMGQPEADQRLRAIVNSRLCRKVIITQRITRDYVVEQMGCDPDKVEFIFGGVFESRIDFDFHRDKKLYGKDKDTIDLCFVAHKYGDDLVSKGYVQFVEIARRLAAEYPRLRLHVVGDYAADDVPLEAAQRQFQFYGRQESAFFRTFYPAMDAIISINRPFALASGAFDGFPTGSCIEAGFHGVLNCINDPLELNPGVLRPEHDFVLLDFEVDKSVERLRALLDHPDRLYALAYQNWRAFHEVFGTDRQLWQRTRLIAAELARQEILIAPPPLIASLDPEHGIVIAQLEHLQKEYIKLEAEYRNLERHFLAAEGERKRLEEYIRSKESW